MSNNLKQLHTSEIFTLAGYHLQRTLMTNAKDITNFPTNFSLCLRKRTKNRQFNILFTEISLVTIYCLMANILHFCMIPLFCQDICIDLFENL